MADALLLSLGLPVVCTNVLALTNFDLNQSTDQLECIFQADLPVNIRTLGLRLNTTTLSPNYKISLQGVTAAGIPDGVIKGGGSPASKVFNPTGLGWGAGSFQTVDLDNGYLPARGEILAWVIAYDSGTIDGSHFASFTSSMTGPISQQFPYGIQNDNGVRTRQAGLPCFACYATSPFAIFGNPFSNVQTLSYTSASSPNEWAMKFSLPAAWGKTFSLAGLRLMIQSGAGNSVTIRLYDTDGTTVLQDVVWDADLESSFGTQRNARVFFDEASLATLKFGSVYTIGLIPAGAGNLNLSAIDVAQSTDWQAWPLENNFYASSRTGAGAWTDLITRRLIAEIILADITVSAPPSTPSLSIADNGNGTGAVATVSGGSSDATHNIYAGAFSGALGTFAMPLVGSRTGNGTVALALPVGYYVGRVEAVRAFDTVEGNEVYFAVTDSSGGSAAVYWRILEAVKARLSLLSLVGSPPLQIMWRPIQLDDINNAPTILITPTGAELNADTWANTDTLAFPVLIIIVDKLQGESALNLARDLKWRDQIARALKGQRLAGVPEVMIVEHYPDAVALPEAWSKNKLVSAMLFRFRVRQTRGLT